MTATADTASGSQSTDSGSTSTTKAFTVHDWARAVLKGLGIAADKQRIHWLTAWAAAEGGHWNNTAHFNPINTTLALGGSTSMNSVGVQSFKNWHDGIAATVKTLKQGNMSGIVQALSGNDGGQFANAVTSSPWGTHHLDIGGDYSSYGRTSGYDGAGVNDNSGSNALTQDIGPADIRQGLNAMGFASRLIHSNKSLENAFQQILHEQLDLTSTAGQTRATQIFQNTKWFQNHTKAQRQFDELKYSDPAQFNEAVQQERDSLKAQAEGLGLQLDPNELDHMAHMVARNGLTSDEVNGLMSKQFKYDPKQGYQGTVGSTIDAIKQNADAYYVPISDHQLQHYTRQVIAGNLDPSSLADTFKQQALSMFPYLKTQLNEGHTVADIADPYKQMMAQTLELDPTSIKHNDPLVMQGLQSTGQNGEPNVMPLWQYQQKLYDDPRWMNTQNAHNTLVGMAGGVLQSLGLLA